MSTEPKNLYRKLEKKWAPVLDQDNSTFKKIKSDKIRKDVAVLLENTVAEYRKTPLMERINLSADLNLGELYEDAKESGILTESEEQALNEDMSSGGGGLASASNTTAAGGILGYDPVMISMLRRALPNLMAYDICGVQPMTMPNGLVFAMRAKYGATAASGYTYEAMFQESDPRWSGAGGLSGFGVSGVPQGGLTMLASVTPYAQSVTGGATANAFADARSIGTSAAQKLGLANFRAMLTATAESLSLAGPNYMNRMAFTIDKMTVTAKSRALAAEYTSELAQDLRAVHGLDAEAELANLLTTEILAEQNREIIRTIYYIARTGSQQADLNGNSAGGGVYDLDYDSDGRWSAERFRGLYFQIERECNWIAKETRRGKGNFIICSSDVASALAMGGFLLISPALNTQLDVDDTGSTFCGVLNGRIRVYVDPYSTPDANFFVAGYRGPTQYDAGLFYCPYVPLQMARAQDPNTFQPKIAFKTRYGLVQNPYVLNSTGVPDAETMTFGLNQYYRLTRVDNLHGQSS